MTNAMPVRIDRLMRGIYRWISGVHPTATIVWAPTEIEQAATQALKFVPRILSGPHSAPIGGESVYIENVPTTATVAVVTANAGEGLIFEATGLKWDYVIQAGDSAGDARDALLALIVTDAEIYEWSAVASGTDKIAISGALGDLWGLDVYADTTSALTLTIDASAVAQAQTVEVVTQIEIQAWSSTTSPRSGATAALSKLLAYRRMASAYGTLEAHGLSISDGSPVLTNIDALSGPDYQSRAVVSLTVSQMSVAVEPVDTIDTTTISTDMRL